MTSEMPIFDQKIEILYVKRKSKQVERFQSEITPTKTRKTPKKPANFEGRGIGLAVSKMEGVCSRIDMEAEMELKTVYYVFYLRRRVAKADVKDKLKAFNGWPFSAASKQYAKALENLLNLTTPCIQWVMNIIGLTIHANDQKEHLIQRLAEWCLRPIDNGDFFIPVADPMPFMENDHRKAPKLEFEEDNMLEVGRGENGAPVILSNTIAGEFDLNRNGYSRVPHISHTPSSPSFAAPYTPRAVPMPVTTTPNINRPLVSPENPRLPPKKRIRNRHTPAETVDLTDEHIPTEEEVIAVIRDVLTVENSKKLTLPYIRMMICRRYPDFNIDSDAQRSWIKELVLDQLQLKKAEERAAKEAAKRAADAAEKEEQKNEHFYGAELQE
ncbi:Oidioi.mRNA.OKI2018_I69.chr1.g1356.t1.cds [Oikopleura dioica]|uniref:Oidioi.mRNA.OKI2018_I69.chr1.g1356.t1.cds n=1 Tax=Oikopleura dioica TaxID=34765 RepID=A0ABN7SSW1_OIKDI|nr:Oidioi.mRNA.OKI2018_I69.chr1.g1356.t1.cds [Oikopleura dioica]